MGLSSRVFATVLVTSILSFILTARAANEPRTFDVRSYGAHGDSKTDSTQAFLKAWKEACEWPGRARVYVPVGTFAVGESAFLGPCKGYVTFIVKGTVVAPRDLTAFTTDTWITFRYIDNLVVEGGGVFDGQGRFVWPLCDTPKTPQCNRPPMSLGFQFIKHSRIMDISSVNSKNAHFNLFACEDVNLTHVTISAAGNSPNTDGIKIGFSNLVGISRSSISTGDDCVAVLAGSTRISVTDVNCGPGHGISVGSIGMSWEEKNVTGLLVRRCVFNGTSDGVRIKTWASPISNAVLSDFQFRDLQMVNVATPINIDQRYCPRPPCLEGESSVLIRNVKYINIWGTTTSEVAVSIQCSKFARCSGLLLQDINLSRHGSPGGSVRSSCSYAEGFSAGKEHPPSCLNN